MIGKIETVLNAIEKRAIQILFICMTTVVLLAVFNRITVNRQMAWSEELSRYLFEWLVFIAAAYASGDKAHIGVTALIDALPRGCRKASELIIYILCLALSVTLVYYSSVIIRTQIQYGQISPSLRIPMQYPYASMIVGGIFMSVHYAIHIIKFFGGDTK